jgi:hypothetical protein
MTDIGQTSSHLDNVYIDPILSDTHIKNNENENVHDHDQSPSSVYDLNSISSDIEHSELYVVGDTMVYTINGLFKICDLEKKHGIEIWSGKRWFRISIQPEKSSKKINKITLCNGACLKCTDSQIWAIIENNSVDNRKKIIPASTDNLEIDMRIPTFKLPDELTGDIVRNAYDVGKQIGKLFISKQYFTSNIHVVLPSQIYKLCPQSLGRFIAGWMDSQNGNIYGNYNVIHDLQLLLARLHIYVSYIIKKNTQYMLEIPDKSNIPNPNNQIRKSNAKIKSNKLYINSIESIELNQKMYKIINLDPKTRTIVLDGVLAII